MSSITQEGKPADHGPVSTANASNSEVSASPSVRSDTPSAPVAYAPSTSNSFEQTAPALASSSVDRWGDLENDNQEGNVSDQEGWDDVDPFEEKSAPSLLSNIHAAQKRPVVQPKQPIPSSSRSNPTMAPKSEDDAQWGPTTVPAPKSASKSSDIKPSVSHSDDDDLWGSIAAPPPKSSGRPSKPAAANSDDLWGAIAAPPPTTKARPLASSGRDRGKPAQPKLGV